MDMCMAAVHNGADAIYVGFPGFNARGRTLDHTWEALEEMILYCHRHQVKVFLALNVLIFEKELRDLLQELPRALSMNPDAFIVQDLGLAQLIRFLCPSQVLHASTQMTVTNHEHIALTEDLGLQRYVLGREVSLDEMAVIREHTEKELEVFVHGALCVAYSGQCLTSEGFGGRSANRGQCAQSCRMEYDLIVDGVRRDLGSLRYLVSPKDLCGLEDIPKLVALGIDSFKIEGRLKTPQYVAATTSAYKEAMAAVAISTGSDQESQKKNIKTTRRDLEVTYSRGFFNGWIGGVDHQHLVDGRYGSHRGSEIGVVKSLHGNALRITSSSPLRAGDGLLFVDYTTAGLRANTPATTWGSRLFSADKLRDTADWEITFANDFPINTITIGSVAYLNDSPTLEREITRSFTDKSLWKTLSLDMRITGSLGHPLQLTISDGHFSTQAESSGILALAHNPATALNPEKTRESVGALSGTGFKLARFEYDIPAGLFITEKEIRKTKQAAIANYRSQSETKVAPSIRRVEDAVRWMNEDALQMGALSRIVKDQTPAQLNLLVREVSSLEALSGLPLHTVYLDFEHGKDYKPSLAKVRAMGFHAGIATTRILKPAEYHNLKVIEALAPDVVLVRNLGALHFLSGKGLDLVGDFSLNVSNSLTAAYLTGKGLTRLCPSYDLNQWQLFDLIDAFGSSCLEITVHQYLPSFHMEHCVFAACLSQGSSFRDCGKPCETHKVELRDHTGAMHPLKADQECRNTMFNGKPQSAARLVPSLLAKGIGTFRIEALYEDAETLATKVREYARLVAGETTSEEVFTRMGVVEKYGVMEGQMRNANVHRDRKKS
jgi:U32 family peptidase